MIDINTDAPIPPRRVTVTFDEDELALLRSAGADVTARDLGKVVKGAAIWWAMERARELSAQLGY